MKKSEKRENARERQRRFLEKKKTLGEVKKSVWISQDELEFFNFLFSNEKKFFRYIMRYCLFCIETGRKFIPEFEK